MRTSNRSAIYFGIPILIGLLMLPVPLLRDLHIESALLASLFGCFWAGWNACSKIKSGSDGGRLWLILRTLYLVGLPLLAYAIVTGCLSLHGIAFWILYPVPGVLFGYSLGRLFRIWKLPHRRLFTISVILFVAVGVLLIEFFNLPQVYFLNHVWGGWPGPIYDETVKVGWSLIFFRGLTLAWVGLFWFLPAFRQSMPPKIAVIFCFLMVMLGYSQLAEMGVISPRSHLQKQLGGSRETPHFILYYDSAHYSDAEIGSIAQKHEFYFQQISGKLGISRPKKSGKIESYLYAHPWQKKKQVGAKFTSYVPVWLNQDQLHIAKQQIEGSLRHELVHVLAKQFGNRLFNASWSIGLIEGLAVAVAPDASDVSTINQIVVSEKPYPSAAEMQKALSFWGFYGGRSAVNYMATGSFVQYLLSRYSPEPFKNAYKNADVAGAYKMPFDSLVSGWHQVLDTVGVDSLDREISARLYGFPSLFEQECPHVQSPFAQQWDRYRFYWAQDDTLKALHHLDAAFAETPDNPFVKNRWAYLHLKNRDFKIVEQQATLNDTTAESLLLFADAFALNRKPDRGETYIAKAADLLRDHPDSVIQKALQVRQDLSQWRHYRDLIYGGLTVDDSTFTSLLNRTQMRVIRQALDQENGQKIKRYSSLIVDHPKSIIYMDTYIQLIEWLAWLGEHEEAEQWLRSIRSLKLRNRHIERLDEAEDWVHFLK